MATQMLRPSRVELYCIPHASRTAFFSGKSLIRTQPRAVGRKTIRTSAVVAPPKPTKDLPPFEAWNTGAEIAKRTDIKTILILGPGPIIIGQVTFLILVLDAKQYSHAWRHERDAARRLVSSTTVGRKHAKLSGKTILNKGCTA